MSCQVHRITKSGKDGAQVANSHNGLLIGLAALCIEPFSDWKGNNDIELTPSQISKGIENHLARASAHPENHAALRMISYFRPDHITDAVKVLCDQEKKAKYGLRLS